MPGTLIREQAAALDAEDPLAGFRGRFVIEPPDRVYCASATLGLPPHSAAEAVARAVEDWGTRLASAAPAWRDAPRRAGDLLAAHVLGARPGEVVVGGTRREHLATLAAAVLAAEPGPVVGLSEDPAADRAVLAPLAAAHDVELRLVSSGQLAHASRDARLIVMSHVDARTSEIVEMDTMRVGRARGLVLWDLTYAAGAVEIGLEAAGADLAIGATGGYLCGGPGAPAYRYVRRERAEALMLPEAPPPSVIALAAVEAALRVLGQAAMPVIAPKTRALTELFVHLHDEWLAGMGFVLASPRGAGARGAHVVLRHARAGELVLALERRAGVVAEHLAPDLVRFAFPALYTRFVDVVDVAATAAEVGEDLRVS